jgi:putative oxidoreductase
MENAKKWGFLGLKALLTAAFVAAGAAKLVGAAPMVAVFEMIGWGQWFRTLTGVIEVGAAILLWVPGLQYVGAGLLVATMIAAVGFHVLVLGPSLVPALVLGLLAAAVLWVYRDQIGASRA